jgi:hypothetical protein
MDTVGIGLAAKPVGGWRVTVNGEALLGETGINYFFPGFSDKPVFPFVVAQLINI